MDQDLSSVILFDGVCNLCNGLVKFVVKRDPRGRFRFAALQSEAGQRLLAAGGLSDAGTGTVVLIEQYVERKKQNPKGNIGDVDAADMLTADYSRTYVKSDAALRISRRLGGLWPLIYVFVVVPRPLRDIVYSFVARNRYKWFGKQDACMVPTPDIRRRFIDF